MNPARIAEILTLEDLICIHKYDVARSGFEKKELVKSAIEHHYDDLYNSILKKISYELSCVVCDRLRTYIYDYGNNTNEKIKKELKSKISFLVDNYGAIAKSDVLEQYSSLASCLCKILGKKEI